jgi:hypothetical protein
MMTSIDLPAYCRAIIEDMRRPWEPPERLQPSRSLAVRHRLGLSITVTNGSAAWRSLRPSANCVAGTSARATRRVSHARE